MDAQGLRAAYDLLFDAASAAQACEAADTDGWTVAMVVAHIAVNDRLIAEHLRRAMDGEDTWYRNLDVYRADDLRPIVDRVPDVASQIDDARATSAEVLALAEELNEHQVALAFRTTILDGDVVQVDGHLPLVGLLGAQARVHLPAHAAQIEALNGA
jgi:hypothetical protein